MGSTSRKSSATIVPSPLVNTFSSQSPSPQAALASHDNNTGDGGVRLSPTPASAPQATMFLPQSTLHYARPIYPNRNSSTGDTRSFTAPAAMAPPTLQPQSTSPYATLAPPDSNDISDVVAYASSTPAPAAALEASTAHTASLAPALSSAPVDNDIEMTDAAPVLPDEADNREDKSGLGDALSIKFTTEPKPTLEGSGVSEVYCPATVEPQFIVPEPDVGNTVPTLSSATAAAINARSAAEFDAAQMLLGLRRTEAD